LAHESADAVDSRATFASGLVPGVQSQATRILPEMCPVFILLDVLPLDLVIAKGRFEKLERLIKPFR